MIGLEKKLPNLIHISGQPIDKAELLMLFDKEACLKKTYTLDQRQSFNFSLNSNLFQEWSKLQVPSTKEQIRMIIDETRKIF